MMSIRSGMNLPPMVLPSGIQHLQMPRMPQMAMNMGVGMGMGLGMGMVDMGATGSGRGLIPVTSATGPAVPHNLSVPGMMMEAHDPRFMNPNLMDPRNLYLARQHLAMQMQQVSSHKLITTLTFIMNNSEKLVPYDSILTCFSSQQS